MIRLITNVLDGPAAAEMAQALGGAEPVDAERQGALTQQVMTALAHSAAFQESALPAAHCALRFVRLQSGEADPPGAVDAFLGSLRADVAYTLSLSDPTSYEGGELTVEAGGVRQAGAGIECIGAVVAGVAARRGHVER